MKAFNANTGKEIRRGDTVPVIKVFENGFAIATGDYGIFEEVTESGLINFNVNGKPRQCMPEGIGATIF